jgi:ribosomal-protein-alanine N-acetyltransferase
VTHDAIAIERADATLVAPIAALEASVFDAPWDAAALTALIDDGLTQAYVARRAGDVVAAALLRVVAGEGELLRIAVAPALQRQGIATRVLRTVLSAAADACPLGVHLEVRASNDAARRLYARAGFVESGRRRAYYQAPREDAILMHWRGATGPGGGPDRA